jgi:hypothetical protein
MRWHASVQLFPLVVIRHAAEEYDETDMAIYSILDIGLRFF